MPTEIKVGDIVQHVTYNFTRGRVVRTAVCGGKPCLTIERLTRAGKPDRRFRFPLFDNDVSQWTKVEGKSA